LLDRHKHEPPDRLACRAFRICGCGHVASLVCGRTEIGCPLSREGSADFGTNLSPEAHN
jgi:hypothetical protein